MSAEPAKVVEPVLQTTESWVESTSRRRSSVTTLDPVQEEEQPVEDADLTRLESPVMVSIVTLAKCKAPQISQS